MDITIRQANPEDALAIGHLRKKVWQTTYRGIYPDEKLDNYPYLEYLQRDKNSILSPEHHWYLFLDGPNLVGCFSFGPYNYGSYKDFTLCLNYLYILQPYQGQGLGKRAFAVLKDYCRQQNTDRFFCGCNANNDHAVGFYRHMGGIPGDEPRRDVPKQDQILHFEFYLGDTP